MIHLPDSIKLPVEVEDLLYRMTKSTNTVVAGGFIRDTITLRPTEDIDVYINNIDAFNAFVSECIAKLVYCYGTDVEITHPNGNVSHLGTEAFDAGIDAICLLDFHTCKVNLICLYPDVNIISFIRSFSLNISKVYGVVINHADYTSDGIRQDNIHLPIVYTTEFTTGIEDKTLVFSEDATSDYIDKIIAKYQTWSIVAVGYIGTVRGYIEHLANVQISEEDIPF